MSIAWRNCPITPATKDAQIGSKEQAFCRGCHTFKTIVNKTYTLCSSCRGKYVYYGESCDVPICDKVSDGSLQFQSRDNKLLCKPCYHSWMQYNKNAYWEDFLEIRTAWKSRPQTFQNLPEHIKITEKPLSYQSKGECQHCGQKSSIENCEYQLCSRCSTTLQYYGETCWCCSRVNDEGQADMYFDTTESVFACKKCMHKKNRYNTTYAVLKSQIRTIHQCQVCSCEINHDKEGSKTQGVACIDHDHDTGKIRGVLCHRCNKLEGAIAKYDCPEEWLQNLLMYLQNPPLTKPGIQ